MYLMLHIIVFIINNDMSQLKHDIVNSEHLHALIDAYQFIVLPIENRCIQLRP